MSSKHFNKYIEKTLTQYPKILRANDQENVILHINSLSRQDAGPSLVLPLSHPDIMNCQLKHISLSEWRT